MTYYEQVLATTSASYYIILHLKSYLIACVCPTDKWQSAFTGCTTRVTQYGSAVICASGLQLTVLDCRSAFHWPSTADGNTVWHDLVTVHSSTIQLNPLPPADLCTVWRENLSASKNYVSSCLRAQTIGILKVKKTIWMGSGYDELCSEFLAVTFFKISYKGGNQMWRNLHVLWYVGQQNAEWWQ